MRTRAVTQDKRAAGGAASGTDAASGGKHAAILEAAAEVFRERGYGAATMDAIARRAGVSKQTVYNHFASKERLFGAIIRSWCDGLVAPLLSAEVAAAGPQAALKAFARAFLGRVLSPTSLGLYRVLMAAAETFPELGRISYDAGPARGVRTLARYLEEESRAGRLSVRVPELAAEEFFGMLMGHLQLRCLLGVSAAPGEREIERRIEHGVIAFLAAHRPPRHRGADTGAKG